MIKLTYIGQVALETYDQFLMSQLIEAVIIGVMIAVGSACLGYPIGVMTGIFAGVLSFIPYVGSMIVVLGAFYLHSESYSIHFSSIAIRADLKETLIDPRAVGQSIGLPALFHQAASDWSTFGSGLGTTFTPILPVAIHRLVIGMLSSQRKIR